VFGSPLLGGLSSSRLRARRSVQFWFVIRAMALLVLAISFRWAWLHPVQTLTGLAALLAVAFAYFAARERARGKVLALGATRSSRGLAVRRVVAGSLDVRQAGGPHALLPMGSLGALGDALEALRDADVGRALSSLDTVEPHHLWSDELRVYEAAHAWTRLLSGDRRGAVSRAVAALPTGLPLLDEVLAPLCLQNALHDLRRLELLLQTWDSYPGVWERSDELRELRAVALAKLGRLEPSSMSSDERRFLVERCRSLGELELATSLASAEDGEATGPKLGYR
jgi:hypothetical protein